MRLDKREIESAHGITFDEYFASSIPKLHPFIEDGLVTHDDARITVHGLGRIVIRNIAMCFDAYIDKLMSEKPIFSKTV
ncbi:MAG: coproporphyrinogen III oxidase, partial [Acidobacteriota bacterium]